MLNKGILNTWTATTLKMEWGFEMKRISLRNVVLVFVLIMTCLFSLNTKTAYAKGITKKAGWYCYMGWEGGKVSNFIYRKGNKLIVKGQLRKVKREYDYPGKKLGRKKWTFKLSKKVKVYEFPEGIKERMNWKTLREWGWYSKKHYAPGVYFRVKKGKVIYIGIHS